ncbi:MAG: DUF4386 family protein [Rhodospirillales bacterium]|jgi:hypothetical protein
MTATALPRTVPAPLGAQRAAGLLLLLQFVLMGTAFGVLATSIDWPQSLGDPASVALPRLLANSGAVALGYGAYLLSALAMIPLAVMLRDTLEMTGTLGRLAVAFGTIAGLAKALGIIRWHVLMPGLAAQYEAGDAATRAAVSVVYEAFNAYAGGIGEVLGVALFSALWTVTLAVALHRAGARRLAWVAAASAVLLLVTIADRFGVDMGPVLTVSGIAWQFVLAAIGIRHLRSAR